MVSFAEIERASQDAETEVALLVMSARQNANDTVYVEKAADESEADAIAMATLQLLLSDYAGPQSVVEWFTSRGVEF